MQHSHTAVSSIGCDRECNTDAVDISPKGVMLILLFIEGRLWLELPPVHGMAWHCMALRTSRGQ